MVLITPLPTKLEDFPQPVDTSSQVSDPDDAGVEVASLEEIPPASSPTAKTGDLNGCTSLSDAAHLWEETNEALGELLSIKSSIDTCQCKLVGELSMALCQNDSKTTESIKEAKAVCTHSIQEAETLCSTAIRETEAWGTFQAGSLQDHSVPWRSHQRGE